MADVTVRVAADAVQFENTIEGVERQLREMTREFRGAQVGSQEFLRLQGNIRATQQHLQTLRGGFAQLSGRGSGSIGMAALQMAYFADDAQYGIRGIVNNIPQLLMAFGAGTGLTGVVAIAAVAANQLWQRLGAANTGMSDSEKAAEAAAEAQKKLTQELNNQAEAYDKLETSISGAFDVMKEMARLNEANQDAELARDIRNVEEDESLSPEEKAEQIRILKDQAAQQKEQAKIDAEVRAMEERQAKQRAGEQQLGEAAATATGLQRRLGEAQANRIAREQLPGLESEEKWLGMTESFYGPLFEKLFPEQKKRLDVVRPALEQTRRVLETTQPGNEEELRQQLETAMDAVRSAAEALGKFELQNFFEDIKSQLRIDNAPLETFQQMEQNHAEMMKTLQTIEQNTRRTSTTFN